MNPTESIRDQLKNEIEVTITKKVQLKERLIQVWFHSPKTSGSPKKWPKGAKLSTRKMHTHYFRYFLILK